MAVQCMGHGFCTGASTKQTLNLWTNIFDTRNIIIIINCGTILLGLGDSRTWIYNLCHIISW